MNLSIYEIEIDPKDYITVGVSDIFGISSEDARLSEKLSEKYPWVDVEYKLSEEKYPQFSISYKLKETLKRCGIKYIKYENTCEGEGYSYLILDDSTKLKRYRLKDFLQGIYKII